MLAKFLFYAKFMQMLYSFLRNFLLHVAIGILSLYLAIEFIEGVRFEGDPYVLAVAGLILGFANFFVKPILKIVTFPLRLITLGLFTFVINIAIVWIVQAMFPDLEISKFLALVYTTLIVCVLEFVFYSVIKTT